jgi:xanthine/CO dehydrogenase XdhC/CoxF family maturation factor
VPGVWKVCGEFETDEGCEILLCKGGRVDVFLALMVKRGREMRNQSQVWVVGVWEPVEGSVVVVGLLIVSSLSLSLSLSTK